ncbi:FG-GAP repeat protein [Enterovibrio norvegicus]
MNGLLKQRSQQWPRAASLLLSGVLALSLVGCDSEGAFGATPLPPAPGALNLLPLTVTNTVGVGAAPVTFEWEAADGATGYTVCRRDTSLPNECEALGTTTTTTLDINMGALQGYLSAFFVLAENEGGISPSNEQSLSPEEVTALVTYVKASNTGPMDNFGGIAVESYLPPALSLSADGQVMAVGASREASIASGIDGDQSDNNAINAGAVYVFRYSAGSWAQETYIKASNTQADDNFGSSLSLSADGNTLAVGAYTEESNGVGVNSGTELNNGASNSGAVYVFRYSGGSWAQEAYVKASNTQAEDRFGVSVSLAADGNTLAVGAYREDSNGVGVNSTAQADNNAIHSGAVYVFRYSAGSWAQEAYIKASNTDAEDWFGYSVSLSADGNTLAVGAYREDSNGLGVNSAAQADNNEGDSGAVYVFRHSAGAWAQEAYIKASNTGQDDDFGFLVSLSADGNTLAVGAADDSNGQGVNSGAQADNSAAEAGAVYVFRHSAGAWAQEAYIKASNTGTFDLFGVSVSLAADGNTLAVGAPGEASNGQGVNSGAQADNSASASGAVYLFRHSAGAWAQEAYIKATNTETGDVFGVTTSLSADGNTLAVGAFGEASSATGLNGDQTNNVVGNAGAVYLF